MAASCKRRWVPQMIMILARLAVVESSCGSYVEKSYGSGSCNGRADGAPCAHFSPLAPQYNGGSCTDGAWCGCSQSKCINQTCEKPVIALCVVVGQDNCLYQCKESSAGKKLCLTPVMASCLEKELGGTCKLEGEDRPTIDSRCGNVGDVNPDKSCGDSNCYGCLSPTLAACVGKNEGDSCHDYTTYDDVRRRRHHQGRPKPAAIVSWSGGNCWKSGSLKCQGASEVSRGPVSTLASGTVCAGCFNTLALMMYAHVALSGLQFSS